MALRLPLDSYLIGYWGFDEAIETDVCVDESSYGDGTLTPTSTPSTQIGRVGNGRTFSSSSYAVNGLPRFRATGDLTLITWIKLGSFNSGGSLLRCCISCSGPTTTDPQQYAVYADSVGRLVYKHTSASGEVVIRTAVGTLRTNQLHNIVVTRASNIISFYVDNFSIPVADVTVNGSGSAQPVPAPSASTTCTLQFGRSLKETDSAFWDGMIDESSVHSIARPYHAYIQESYMRAVLRTATFHTTSMNNLVTVSSADMGLGIRWWCYERDKDLYVVKESPFGSFGPETRLTTNGNASSTLATRPELIYDAASDTLLVAFISGNRIYKLTAASNDDPATINMPFTADTGTIIKEVEPVDNFRAGEGSGGQRPFLDYELVMVNRTPIKLALADTPSFSMGEGGGGPSIGPAFVSQIHTPSVVFTTLPTYGFGVLISAQDTTQKGYKTYAIKGGVLVALADPILLPSGLYFSSVSPRVYGLGYVVQVLTSTGAGTGVFSDVLVDRFTEPVTTPDGLLIYVGRAYDANDGTMFAEGYGGQREVVMGDFVFTNRTPLKLSYQDSGFALGEGSSHSVATVTQSSKTIFT